MIRQTKGIRRVKQVLLRRTAHHAHRRHALDSVWSLRRSLAASHRRMHLHRCVLNLLCRRYLISRGRRHNLLQILKYTLYFSIKVFIKVRKCFVNNIWFSIFYIIEKKIAYIILTIYDNFT